MSGRRALFTTLPRRTTWKECSNCSGTRTAMFAAGPGADSGKVSKQVMAGLAGRCPKCGQLSENAVAMLAMAGSDLMKNAVFGGPNVAARGRGHCPGCGSTIAQVTFDPSSSES